MKRYLAVLTAALAPFLYAATSSAADNPGSAPATASAPAGTANEKGFNSGDDPMGGVTVDGLFGYGFADGVNLGFGIRGGYTLPMKLYLGATFVYHVGTSQSVLGYSFSEHLFYTGVEGGYDILAGPLVVRPYLGLGPAVATGSAGGLAGGSSTDTKIGFWPGAVVAYPLEHFHIGADARFLVVNNFNAFSVFATGGYSF